MYEDPDKATSWPVLDRGITYEPMPWQAIQLPISPLCVNQYTWTNNLVLSPPPVQHHNDSDCHGKQTL